MKIVLAVNELNIRGGTHKQVLRLAQYLKSQGHEVHLFTRILDLGKTYPEFSVFDIIVDAPIKASGLKKLFHTIKVCMMLSKEADVFNIHDCLLEKYIIIYRVLHPTKKIVWQINDLPGCFPCGVNENTKQNNRAWIDRLVATTAAKCCNRITVNVTKNKERVAQFLHRDADVLYCGVDINRELVKHSYSISDEKVNLLSSGVFFPYRNYETLIQVVDKMRGGGKHPIHLDIIGSTANNPWYADSVSQMIKDKGLTDFITIHGQVDEKKYNDLHNKADIFAFVNVNQSWGLAVFEAMSCGLPVIVSNSVGATELLHDGVDSVFVDPMNADEICNQITELICNREKYDLISLNAYNAVKKYSWDDLYSKKMEDIFFKLNRNKNLT